MTLDDTGAGDRAHRAISGQAASVNRDHWEALGARYTDNWGTPSQQALSELELAFVIRHLPQAAALSVLDVGIGNGRILAALAAQPHVDQVYGLDIAPAMVDVCRNRFADDPKVRQVAVCDISSEPLPVPGDLHFISAIRMLKYNANWWQIIEQKLGAHLATGGTLVFTMANRRSVKQFSRSYSVPYAKVTERELRTLLEASGWEILEITGFSKVPDLVYRTGSRRMSQALLAVERALDRLVGSGTGAREIFVAARRPVHFDRAAL